MTESAKLAKSELITQGDAICAKYTRQIAALPNGTDEASTRDQFVNTLQISHRELDDLRKLADRAKDGPDLDSMFAQLDKALALGEQKTDEIAANPQLFSDPNYPVAKAFTDATKMAEAFGFKRCGQPANSSSDDTTSTSATPTASVLAPTADAAALAKYLVILAKGAPVTGQYQKWEVPETWAAAGVPKDSMSGAGVTADGHATVISGFDPVIDKKKDEQYIAFAVADTKGGCVYGYVAQTSAGDEGNTKLATGPCTGDAAGTEFGFE